MAEFDYHDYLVGDIHIRNIKGMCEGKEALIVGSGPSGINWKKHRADVLIGINAVNIPGMDFHVVMEPTARVYGEDWWGQVSDDVIKVHHGFNYLKRGSRLVRVSAVGLQPRTCIAFRSHHWAGWYPREYTNLDYVDPLKWCSALDEAHRGFRRKLEENELKEEGLLKGALTVVKLKKAITGPYRRGKKTDMRQAVGTTTLQALHLALYLGCSKITTIGTEFCWKDGNHYWFKNKKNPRYEPGANAYTRPECLNQIEIEDRVYHSFWWYTASAIYLLKEIKPRLEEEGIVWEDRSEGLLQIPQLAKIDYLDGNGKERIVL